MNIITGYVVTILTKHIRAFNQTEALCGADVTNETVRNLTLDDLQSEDMCQECVERLNQLYGVYA